MFFFNNKFFARIAIGVTVVGIVLGNFSLPAQAGTFNHVHVDKCYKSVSKTCNDHEFRHGKETTNRDCSSCGGSVECNYDTYTDVCRKGLVADLYCAWTITCKNCGRVIENSDKPALRKHTYSVTELGCGKKTSSTAATTEVSVSTREWTNKNVSVSCTVSVNDGSFSLASNPYSFNGGSFSGTSSCEVSENGNYSFTVKDSQGRTVTDSVTVSNIDKTAPTVSLSKSTEEWTESGLTISASASDDLSGLADAPFSFNGGQYGTSGSMNVTTNGTYSVTVMDKAGNTASASITVSNIGKDPAIIEKEKREEEERKRREEEERKRKEEEEKKKEEDKRKEEEQQKEEERKRREEEEKKQKEEAEKDNSDKSGGDKNNDDNNKKDESGGNKIKDLLDKLTGNTSETDNSSVEEEEDVSGNESDVSENDVSGNLIPVNGINSDKTGIETKGDQPIDFNSSNEVQNLSLIERIKQMGNSRKTLMWGTVLVVLALGLLSTINIVYTSKDGKLKPVSTAKVSRNKKKMIVTIPSSGLEEDRKYNIFYSLWTRLFRGGRKVVIDVDGHTATHVTDDGLSFVYNG